MNTMFAITKWSQDQCTRIMYLNEKEKKIYKSPHYIPHKQKSLPLTKMSYTNYPPKYMTTLIPKPTPLFVTNDKGQVTEKQSTPYRWKS